MEKKSLELANEYRTHTCNALGIKEVGKHVRLSGWVHARRDHGGLIFIDIRDRWGITQVTFNPDKNKEAWQIAEGVRAEYIVQVEGVVLKRPTAMVNEAIDTGKIEVEVSTITVLSEAHNMPFEIAGDNPVGEDIRLKYRFLDLRRPRLQELMRRRDEFLTFLRQYMHDHEFTEVQTPILANSSPEGARDYLVPSRLHPGQFYALPQAPQQFKQLLMVAGFDRYFQIAPCFRDEDPRADRHPGEFYQLDMEMSFVTQEDIFVMMEPLWIEVTKKFSDKKLLTEKFPRIPWREALTKYGSDKPDLRYDFFITNVSEIVANTDFKVFTDVLAKKGVIHALHVPGGANLSRKDIDELTAKAKEHGASGLAYILVKDELSSPILKFMGDSVAKEIIKTVKAEKGDAVFFGAGEWLTICKSLGAVRVMSAQKLKAIDNRQAAWCWIVDFPMYEWNEDEKKIDFSHNPFSMPQGGMEALEKEDPINILAYQYDMVLNGFEVSSGAIRNHKPEIMYKAFEIAGYKKEEVDAKFGAMIRAFEYGAPPHGGNAPGIDRVMMVLWDLMNIRDIYAFPKNGSAQDAMMSAPSTVSDKQLKDLHIRLVSEK